MATTVNPNKLSFGFTEAANFRYAGKTVRLDKATDELKVLDKNGNEKTIKGFQAADGTFFRLKKTADGKHQIDVYGTPEQLARSNLQVRGGDVTRARFGDERYRKTDSGAFSPRDFEINGIDSNDLQTFADAYGLSRRGAPTLDAGGATTPTVKSPDDDKDLTEELLQKKLEDDRQQTERRMSMMSARTQAESLIDEQSPGGRRHSMSSLSTSQTAQTSARNGLSFDSLNAAAEPELDSPHNARTLNDSELNEREPLWTQSTPIDRGNCQALTEHPGLGAYFTDPDPTFRDALSRQLALLAGEPMPAPGTSPLNYLQDGAMTLGELTRIIDGLSVALAPEAPKQSPRETLAALGRTAVPTLDDGNCLFAALAHGLEMGDSQDRDAALDQRRTLLQAFEQAQPYPDQVEIIAGRSDPASLDRVRTILSQGLDGGRVDADGWGGDEALKLAAMKHNRSIITVSDQDSRVFDPKGGVTIYSAADRSALTQVAQSLDRPVIVMIEGFHWQATEPLG